MRSIATLALKDLRLLIRDRAGLFWVLAFPLGMAVFFGSIFGGSGEPGASPLRIAVVDEDNSPAAADFIQSLRESDGLRIQKLARAEAETAVRRGELTAYVVLSNGFGESGGLFTGKPLSLEVGIDPSRRAEAGYLKRLLTEASFKSIQKLFVDPGSSRSNVQESLRELEKGDAIPAAQREVLVRFMSELDQFLGTVDPEVYKQGPQFEPLQIVQNSVSREGRGPRSAFEVSFPQAILWGLIGCIAAFAISIVKERGHGTLLRLRIAPLTRAQMLAGKALACWTACVLLMILLLAVGRLVFGVRLEDPGSLALAVGSTSVGFVGIMMLLSVLGRSEQAVAGAGWGVLIIMAMFGGGMVPLMMMPSWMQPVSSLSPVKWGILALEGAIWREFTLAEMLVPCSILFAVGAVCFIAGSRILSRVEA